MAKTDVDFVHTTRNMDDYTIDELLSVCISRQVKDGEVLAQGINTPLVMAGFILAKCTHASQVRFASAIGQGICEEWGTLHISRVEESWLGKAMLNVGFVTATADLLPKYKPKEFFRPAQVDPAGNFNNIAFGSDYYRPRLRLPGTGGIPDVTPYSNQVYLYVPRHSRVVFVPQVDFVSGLGHSDKRIRGSGPNYLISNLGQFDWIDGEIRLTHLHPGVSLEQIQKKTGFPIRVAQQLAETQPPSDRELKLLREDIDPLNVRKLELLSGGARKRLLRKILEQEAKL